MESVCKTMRPTPALGDPTPFNIRQDLPWNPFEIGTIHLDSRMLFETLNADGQTQTKRLDLADHVQKWEFFALSDLMITFTYTGNALRNTGFFCVYYVRDPAIDGSSNLRNVARFLGVKYIRYGNSVKVMIPIAEQGYRCGAQESDVPNRFESLGRIIIRPIDIPGDVDPRDKRFREFTKYSVSLSGTLYGKAKSYLRDLITTYFGPDMTPQEYFDVNSASLITDPLTGAVSFKIRFFEALPGYGTPWNLQAKTSLRFSFKAGNATDGYEDFDVSQSFMTAKNEDDVPTFTLPTQLASIGDTREWSIEGPVTIVYDTSILLWCYFQKTSSTTRATLVNIGGRL